MSDEELRGLIEKLTISQLRTDEQLQRTDEQLQRTDEQLQLTDATLKALAEQSARTDEQVRQTSRKVDALTGKWGRFVEGMVEPNVVPLFQSLGIEIEEVVRGSRTRRNGGMEVDLLGINGTDVVVVEVKSTLSVDDVNEHLARLARFKSCFPRFSDLRVLGAVAGAKIDENADRYAYRKGLYVLAQSGNTMMIANDAQFQPSQW